MREADRLKSFFVRQAITEIEHEWGKNNSGKSHHLREYLIERYIWRTEDVSVYRVAVGENINTGMTSTPEFDPSTLQTRMLEYVPTGRIRYDNTVHPAKAVLFEYRLKNARDTENRMASSLPCPPHGNQVESDTPKS